MTLLWQAGLLLAGAFFALVLFWTDSPAPSWSAITAACWLMWHKATIFTGAFRHHPSSYLPSLWLVLSFVLVTLAWQVVSRVLLARRGQQARRAASRSRQRWEIEVDAASLNWPVVALALSAIDCGRALQELREQEQAPAGVLQFERVAIRRAERVIARAWQTRYRGGARVNVRWHQRKQLKAHAWKVITALRAVEARQDSAPAEALTELATMLLLIAERYAQGHIGQLLNDDQLPREVPHRWLWLRLLLGGAVLTAVLVGLAKVGMPDGAAGPLAGLLITCVLVVIYRGSLPGLRDYLSLSRDSGES
ncbi:hypothetical protein [Streptomyces griseofuscus]|uniref:hypothetical protein n=1 Tax=Streptomyces griseofuscus TaxID=146922 RepID=UPI003821BD10